MPENCAAIVIAAKHHELAKVKDTRGTTHTVGALRCKFDFRTNDWANAAKTAMFCNGNALLHPEVIKDAISVPLDADNECSVPLEVLTDTLPYSVGVWGVTDKGFRIVSRWLVFEAQDGCYAEGSAPSDPEPTVYEQIISISKQAVDTANEVTERANNGEFDGVGIINSEINTSGELVLTYSDGKVVNVGVVVGEDGAVPVDAELSTTSTNPVQNRMVTQVLHSVHDAAIVAWEAAENAQTTANTAGGLAQYANERLNNAVIPQLATLETTVAEHGEVCDFVKENKQGISSLQGFDVRINSLEEQVSDIDTTITKNTSDINETNERVDALENVAHDVPAILDGLGQQISDLETKVDEIGDGVTVDDSLSTTSTNPVQNKVVTARIKDMQDFVESMDHDVANNIVRINALETTVQERGVLIVAWNGEDKVDCDTQRIWMHANNGGTVLLQAYENWYIPLSYVNQEHAYFHYVADDLTFCQWTITGQGEVTVVEDYGLASIGDIGDVRSMVTALETQVGDMQGLANDFNTDIAYNRHRIIALETQVGDIDTALDDIIALQQSLIGGDGE